MLVALMVPIAAASNSTVLRCSRTYDGAGANEIPVVLAGAVISTLVALLLSWPLVATRRDMLPVGAWAGCNWRFLACVRAGCAYKSYKPRSCRCFVCWGWSLVSCWSDGAGRVPGANVLQSGSLVIGALVVNQLLGWYRSRLTIVES